MLKLKENDEAYDLDPITELCLKIYPDQIDCMQATTQTQYWLNGPDPLDYVNIYINNDDKNNGLYSHFHYVSLGLTDLYGDERVHKKAKSNEDASGYGYELTFRIKKDIDEKQAPKWPIKLMQALAKYTFNNGGLLDIGDHIPNVLNEFNSKLKHVLICDDFELKPSETRFGRVKFLQILGCTDDELKYAQELSTRKIIDLMKKYKELGKDYLITDMSRSKSIFEIDSELKKKTNKLVKRDSSSLGFLKSNCFWKVSLPNKQNECFISFDKIEFLIDLKTAKLIPTILIQRIEKNKSFIFNGLDGKNLIFVPENFSNKNCFVNDKTPMKTNGIEYQIYIYKALVSNIMSFFEEIQIENMEKIEEPLTKNFFLSENDNFYLEFKIISNEKIIEIFENM